MSAQLTISSPLEAHKSHTICHGLIAVDVGYENPIFASIEVDYADLDEDPTGQAIQSVEKVMLFIILLMTFWIINWVTNYFFSSLLTTSLTLVLTT